MPFTFCQLHFKKVEFWLSRKLDVLLTAQDADLAALVLTTQGDRVALLGGHRAHCPLAVGTLNVGVIVGVVLGYDVVRAAGIQGGLDGIPAKGLVLPRDHRGLLDRRLVVAGERDRLEEDDDVPLCEDLDRDGPGRL